MKKLLLGLGTLTAVAVPVIAVVSCMSEADINKKTDGRLYRTFNGVNQKFVFTRLDVGERYRWRFYVGNLKNGYWRDVV